MYLRCSSQSLLTAISGRDSCNGEGYIKECLPNTVSDVYSFSDVDTKTVSQILGEFEFCVCRDDEADGERESTEVAWALLSIDHTALQEIYGTELDFTNEMSQYSSRAQKQLEEVEFIRKHVLFNRSTKRLKEIFFTVREAMYQTNKVAAQVFLCTGVVQGIAQAALLFVAAREVFAGHMQVGYVATAFGYFTTMVTSVEYFEQFGRDYQSARVN